MRLFSAPIVAALGLLFVSAAPDETNRPYKARQIFTDVSVVPMSPTLIVVGQTVTGNATHLGLFTGTQTVLFNPTNGTFTGCVTVTAADGSTLTATFQGVQGAQGAIGGFDIVSGTRRFVNASGSGTFANSNVAPGITTSDAIGVICF